MSRSSPEQVGRIFTEFIPDYVKAQTALGQPARVLFFAHGGLIEEREGLLPVLARRRCWAMNGVYPVYFVWETGLKETIRDILGGVVPTRDVRGALTDAAIEKLARNGGKQVWGQMKKSAQKAAGPDGGGRLVAELAGKLWKATNGQIEFHALGHSAGAILHAFFLPLLVAQKPAGVASVDVRTLHFLAPAITTDLFKERLKKLIGPGQPITRAHDLYDDRRVRAGRQFAQALREVAPVSGEQCVRGRGPDSDPWSAEESQAGSAADSLLRPGRDREGR